MVLIVLLIEFPSLSAYENKRVLIRLKSIFMANHLLSGAILTRWHTKFVREISYAV